VGFNWFMCDSGSGLLRANEFDQNGNYFVNLYLYRTNGVIFFIDYCTALRDT
jgi:hypothetical protein